MKKIIIAILLNLLLINYTSAEELVEKYVTNVNNYIKIEDYYQALSLGEQCYSNTKNIECAIPLLSFYFDVFNGFNNILNGNVNVIDSSIESAKRNGKSVSGKKYETHFYYLDSIINPDKINLFPEDYSSATNGYDKAKIIIKVFNILKTYNKELYRIFSNFVNEFSNDKEFINILSTLRQQEKLIKSQYEFYVSYVVCIPTINMAVNKIYEAKDSFFTDQNKMRDAARILGKLNDELLSSSDERTRNRFVDAFRLFKENASDKLFEEFKVIQTMQDNLKFGRNGGEKWWYGQN